MHTRDAAHACYRLTSAALALMFAILLFATSGCATFLGRLRLNAADARFSYGAPGGPVLSQVTTQTLRAYNIPSRLDADQLDALTAQLDAAPTPELVYAYVETAYLQARTLEKKDPAVAKQLYISAALYAYHYCCNPFLNSRNVSIFNAETLDVCMLYNGACERLLHLALQDADPARFPFRGGSTTSIALNGSEYSIYTKIETCSWHKEELDSFELVADRPVDSLEFDCRRAGVGVPLIAKRRADRNRERVEEEYYPEGLYFPMTAILRPNPALSLGTLPPIVPNAQADSPEEQNAQATLSLYDPLVCAEIDGYTRGAELESDVTAPLAYFLNEKSRLNDAGAKKGLLKPEELREFVPTDLPTRERTLQGLYMLEPYDPEKIPVVMTHGLGSSPSTWLEMYNALRNAPDIQTAYQFWFYFYPTGQPFWASAAQLRLDLARLRETVDPGRKAPALDRIVLIGHSMGGLISRMQVQRSENKIWNTISSAPLERLDLDDETKRDLRSWFFFEPNPSVRRVVTIATPFEGSEYANNFTQWIAERVISIPHAVTRVLNTATTKNNIDDPRLLETTTSVDALSPKCPIFATLDTCEIPKDVALNNIVGVLPNIANRRLNPYKTDGVVDFHSAHRDDVETEREVPAQHVDAHRHPAAIMEVKEILTRHLAIARAEVPTLAQRARPARQEGRSYEGPVYRKAADLATSPDDNAARYGAYDAANYTAPSLPTPSFPSYAPSDAPSYTPPSLPQPSLPRPSLPSQGPSYDNDPTYDVAPTPSGNRGGWPSYSDED